MNINQFIESKIKEAEQMAADHLTVVNRETIVAFPMAHQIIQSSVSYNVWQFHARQLKLIQNQLKERGDE